MNWNDKFAQRTRHMKRSAIRELLKLAARPDMISFAGGLPAPELFPIEAVKQAIKTILRRNPQEAFQYSATEGIADLRTLIASRFSRPGLEVRRENVVIVSGAQQGLDLLGRVLLDAGDKVAVENPTYLALLSAWRPWQVRFLPVPSDDQGLRIDALEPLFEQRPKLLYLIPNFQNPQGTTLVAARRTALTGLARKHGVVLIEDDPYEELRFCGDPLPRLFELDARRTAPDLLDSHTIYVGTFSKVLMPGLRVGWIIAPEPVIEKIVQAKQAVDLHTSTLSQWIVHELVLDGTLEQQIPRLRCAYRARRDAMLAALAEYFPSEVSWTTPEGGMFLMVRLPPVLRATDVLERALRQNVAFVPGDDFHLDGEDRNSFRLNFSNPPPELIGKGVERLGHVLKAMLRAA
ncbi:MAG: PLP-dependent aminotransferase family protein [Verrucomicrobia bacterium]|nr:PLP-dependent aminotransferase family protein [Verrucomicrobiota bacterium]